jgi:NTE family protein
MPGGLAVVLSGGGAKGAFQVGVLDELITNRAVKFDIFAGVSTGSIQALGGAMNDMPALVAHWQSIKGNSDIYKKRPFGVAGAVFGADSLYDGKALKERLVTFADAAKLKAAKRKLLVGTVNLATGDYVDKDPSALPPGENIGEWVYASCAQPPFFQPLRRADANGVEAQWVDGGVRNVTPLDSAMKQKPRAVLVVMASPPKPPTAPGKIYDNLIDIALRSSGVLLSEVMSNDTDNAMLINDLIAARESQFRQIASLGIGGAQLQSILAPLDTQLAKYSFAPIRIVHPDPGFEGSDTLEFNPAKIAAGIAAGRAVASAQWPMLKPFLGM